MKKHGSGRLLALMLALVMVISMIPASVFAAEETATYEKVTSALEDWSGEYLLVYEETSNSGLVLNGSLMSVDIANNYVSATLADGSVSADRSQAVVLEKVDGGYVMKTASGKYLYTSSDKNGMSTTDNQATAAKYPLTLNIGSDGETDIVCNGQTHMRFNAAADQMRFRYYKSTSYANQKPVALYKLAEQEDPYADIDKKYSVYVPVEAPQAGDTVLIYNPGNSAAVTSEILSNFYLTPETLSVDSEKGIIATDSARVAWTVSENNGVYTFTQGDKTLTLGENNGKFNLNISAAGSTGWDLDTCNAENHSYYLSGNGVSGQYGKVYIEYYAKYTEFSAYCTSEDRLTEKDFGFVFYKMVRQGVTDIEPDPTAPTEPVVTGPLADGDKVVIYNPANMKALSQNYTGNYNSGVDVTMADGVLSGFTAAEVWIVGVNADGTYTFSTTDGKKLAMGEQYSSMPLDEANPNWEISAAETTDCFYIKNTVRGNYMEWYADKNNWSSYYKINNEALFAQTFYKVTGDTPTPDVGNLPQAGSQVVIYNVSAKGILAAQDDNADSPSITGVEATIADGKAVGGNGGVVFMVEKNGDYYRFKNETYGYLCSNGTGNNAFYSETASEDADWTLAAQGSGFTMESRTAKFNGKYAQYMEYYAGAYKTFSMYNVTDYGIYTFQFYPCANTNITAGIINQPTVNFGAPADAYVGQNYSLTFTVDAPFGVKELTVALNEEALACTQENGVYTVTIPAEKVAGEELILTVTGKDTKDVDIKGEVTIPVKDEPVFTNETPKAGSETGADKRPAISVEVANAGETPTVAMTVNGEAVEAAYADGKVSYTPEADLADGRTTVTVTVTRGDGKEAAKTWSFVVGESQYQLYFGQLHSHTTYSDGSGTLESALEYVKNLPESANVDFVAFTDHSNYFDKSGAANPEGALYDMSLATEYSQQTWAAYKDAVAAFNAAQSDIVAIAGFEMTWSGGPGHINTFNTPGIVSRNNTTLNNKTSDAGMQAYYALLSQTEGADSLSQFNHPGSTFGTFSDFSYWNAVIDSRIYLVEVGNGEGQIGAGGYYPSYEYYTMALDKGWHVAPTNNQDNHKGKWGNANDARDVILTDDFTEEGIYAAIRAMRMYATEDKNLEITYTVNDLPLGSSITEVPEKLHVVVTVNDPDASDSISKVEVIANSGKVIYTWSDPAALASGELTAELDPDYSYYYIRVTEGDGDLAVTAPVWVGESLKLGISSLECGTSLPVTGEELTLTTTLFNSEASDATVKSITYTTNGSVVLGVDTESHTIPASGTLSVDFPYTPDTAKVMTVTVTAVVEQDGKEYTFTKDITLDVQDAEQLVYIGIDASHYNEYVAGNYKDSMGNFSNLAAEYSIRTVELKTSEDLISACGNEKYKMIILTAPSRRDGTALRDPYGTYSDTEIAALVAFNKAGGTVVLAGWSDYYESYASFPAEDHMAAQQNKLLAALGSSIRISDDGTNDDSLNGGQTQRLYFNTYGDSFLTEGVEVDPEHPNDRLYTEVFSHYGGASVYVVDDNGNPTAVIPETVAAVAYGHASTYSKDSDNDGLGGSDVPKYTVGENDSRLMVMATEQISGQGLIVVSGAAFMSNFEVQATIEDSGSEKNYSNYRICENLLKYVNPVQITDIAEVQAQTEEGYKYTIEGIVTSNASGYDKDTAFFDCIYVQDATAGINAFPVAGNYKVGDKVRITGTTSSYQGERQIAVSSIELISEGNPVEPKEVAAAQVNDGSVLGSLITLKGTVVSFEEANGLVQTIMVKDEKGDVARVFIDGYITTGKDVEKLEVGAKITVTGLASYDNTFNAPEGPFPRIRVRDRADVICTAADVPVDPSEPSKPTDPEEPSEPSKPVDPSNPTKPGTDVPKTGDETPLALWIALMVVSAAMIVALIAFLWTKRYKPKH